jgi:hypothetical protein
VKAWGEGGEVTEELMAATAHSEADYSQLGHALGAFTVKLNIEYTSANCKITSATPISWVEVFNPLWEIQSKTDQLLPKETHPDAACPGGVMECQPAKCDVIMVLRSPGIPTPWGSVGSITLQTVQITLRFTVCATGATTQELWINGKKQARAGRNE